MKKPLAVLFLIVSTALFCGARDWDGGLFSSPDGFGLCCNLPETEKSFHTISINLDCYDRIFGNGGKMGVVLNYSQNKYLTGHLYAGPGVSAGYVRDKGDTQPGPMAAVTGTIGLRFVSARGLSLDISLRTALGLRLNINDNGSDSIMDFYNRGLTHTLFPRIVITFPLK